MRLVLAACLTVILGASPSFADYAVTFSTDHTGAQTQIDMNHTTAFDFSVLTGAPTITEIDGIFNIKRGPHTTENITFTLWDRNNGYQDPSAVALKTFSLIPSQVDNSFSDRTFTLAGLTLGVGDYSVSLTSPAADAQSRAYFIKGGNPTTDPSTYIKFGPKAVPEPGGLALMGIGLGSLGLMAARRRRAARPEASKSVGAAISRSPHEVSRIEHA